MIILWFTERSSCRHFWSTICCGFKTPLILPCVPLPPDLIHQYWCLFSRHYLQLLLQYPKSEQVFFEKKFNFDKVSKQNFAFNSREKMKLSFVKKNCLYLGHCSILSRVSFKSVWLSSSLWEAVYWVELASITTITTTTSDLCFLLFLAPIWASTWSSSSWASLSLFSSLLYNTYRCEWHQVFLCQLVGATWKQQAPSSTSQN